MITGILALIVAFFVTKGVGTALLRRGAQALGYGLATAAATGGERIKKGIAQAKAATPSSTDDFGRIVFGSDEKYVEAVSSNTIDSIASQLSTPEGKAAAAKRLAGLKKAT